MHNSDNSVKYTTIILLSDFNNPCYTYCVWQCTQTFQSQIQIGHECVKGGKNVSEAQIISFFPSFFHPEGLLPLLLPAFERPATTTTPLPANLYIFFESDTFFDYISVGNLHFPILRDEIWCNHRRASTARKSWGDLKKSQLTNLHWKKFVIKPRSFLTHTNTQKTFPMRVH